MIELLITLAVVVILTSLALPSYRTIVEKRQVTSGAEQIKAFMTSAQLESVKRNQFVAVNYRSSSGIWCLGMRAGDVATTTCNCTVTDVSLDTACVLDGALRVFNSGNLSYPEVLSSASVGGDGTLVFDPVRGLIVGGETADLDFQSAAGSYALTVEVIPTGRAKICNDTGSASKKVPGIEPC